VVCRILQVSAPADSTADAHVRVTWYPTRQGQVIAELHVRKRGGGRWRFPLHLTAEVPDVDGTVVCEAHMDRTVSVAVPIFAPGA
jgi:hypothetical protein